MEVVLYSTHCPKCAVLEQKLDAKKVDYELITDVATMLSLGFRQAPILKVDHKYMNFIEANQWINDLEVEK